MKQQIFTAVAALGIGISSSAHALFADFTDNAQFGNGDFTQVIGGVTVTISANGGNLNFNETTVGSGSESFCAAQSGIYACDQDGTGIDNDEITTGQELIVDFSEVVEITMMAFLDLFLCPDDCQQVESALVDYNDDGTADDVFVSNENFAVDQAGFQEEFPTVPVFTSRVIFRAGGDGDGQGFPGAFADYAVAGIEFGQVAPPPPEEIPVPAALPLLLTAMAGLGFMGWRRRAA